MPAGEGHDGCFAGRPIQTDPESRYAPEEAGCLLFSQPPAPLADTITFLSSCHYNAGTNASSILTRAKYRLRNRVLGKRASLTRSRIARRARVSDILLTQDAYKIEPG